MKEELHQDLEKINIGVVHMDNSKVLEILNRIKEIEGFLDYHGDYPIDNSGDALDIITELLDIIYGLLNLPPERDSD